MNRKITRLALGAKWGSLVTMDPGKLWTDRGDERPVGFVPGPLLDPRLELLDLGRRERLAGFCRRHLLVVIRRAHPAIELTLIPWE
jgi:hypothetical protein